MLADEDHPLEDLIAAPVPPDPKLMVVYRTRGVPWLLVPPLLLLAGIAAIVVYRRSERHETFHPPLARDVPTSVPAPAPKSDAAEPPGTAQDGRAQIDAMAELAELTGRPVAPKSPASADEGPRFDQTPPVEPPPVAAETKAPATAPKEIARPPEPPKEIAKPARPAETVPASASTARNEPPPDPPAEKPNGAAAIGSSPFDPLIGEPGEKTSPSPPAAARAAAVGFDPDAARSVIATEPAPVTERPAAPGPAPAQAVEPPAAEPFALDPRDPKVAGRPVDPKRAQRTREALEDAQAEAERRLSQRLHLEAIMPDILDVPPAERARRREEFVTMVRRLAARDRPLFHEELRRALRDFGRNAGPEIQAIREHFTVDSVPEIAVPATRDLTGPAARLTLEQRINRMRRWGMPETMILDDVFLQQERNIRGRDGAGSEDQAWVYAARILLAHPPPAPRVPSAPSALAAPSR